MNNMKTIYYRYLKDSIIQLVLSLLLFTIYVIYIVSPQYIDMYSFIFVSDGIEQIDNTIIIVDEDPYVIYENTKNLDFAGIYMDFDTNIENNANIEIYMSNDYGSFSESSKIEVSITQGHNLFYLPLAYSENINFKYIRIDFPNDSLNSEFIFNDLIIVSDYSNKYNNLIHIDFIPIKQIEEKDYIYNDVVFNEDTRYYVNNDDPYVVFNDLFYYKNDIAYIEFHIDYDFPPPEDVQIIVYWQGYYRGFNESDSYVINISHSGSYKIPLTTCDAFQNSSNIIITGFRVDFQVYSGSFIINHFSIKDKNEVGIFDFINYPYTKDTALIQKHYQIVYDNRYYGYATIVFVIVYFINTYKKSKKQ